MNPYQDIKLDEARMSAAQRLSNAWDKQRAKSDASLRRTPSSIPKKEEPKKEVAEAKDPGEYDQEGDMAKGQLRTIIANAKRAHDMLDDNTNMAEWVQSKITLASDYISSVADYMQSQIEEAYGPAATAAIQNKEPSYHVANMDRKDKQNQLNVDRERSLARQQVARGEDPTLTHAGNAALKSQNKTKLKEETLSELNKDTLYSYRRKADKDLDKQGNELDSNVRHGKAKEANKNSFKVSKRMAGIDRAETRLNKESAICSNCQADPCICDVSHGFVSEAELDEVFADQGSGSTAKDNAEYMKRRNAAKKPSHLTPGWMLKKDPELGAKVKAMIKIGKARAKSHGDINAGKDVKTDIELHNMVERLIDMRNEVPLTMDNYDAITGKLKESAGNGVGVFSHELSNINRGMQVKKALDKDQSLEKKRMEPVRQSRVNPVSEEQINELSKDTLKSYVDKLMAMKKELSIVQKSHTKMEKDVAKAKEKADAAPSQEDHDSALNHFKTQYLNAKRNKDDQGANDAARGYHDYSHKLSNIYQRKLKGLAIGEETNPYGNLV